MREEGWEGGEEGEGVEKEGGRSCEKVSRIWE